jgi:hypothetical protein
MYLLAVDGVDCVGERVVLEHLDFVETSCTALKVFKP